MTNKPRTITRTYVSKRTGDTITKTYTYEHKQSKLGSKYLIDRLGRINMQNIKEFKHSYPEEYRPIVMQVLTPYIVERKTCTSDQIRGLIDMEILLGGNN